MRLAGSLLLLGGSLGLLGLLTGGGASRLTEPPTNALAAPADSLAAPGPDGLIATSLARPLFAPDRRPPTVALPVADTAAAPVPPPLGFIGTVRTAGQGRAAVTLSGKRWLIAVGETVEGWRVERIGSDHLLLRSPDGLTAHRVVAAAGAPGAAAVPPPAAAFQIPPIPPLPARPR